MICAPLHCCAMCSVNDLVPDGVSISRYIRLTLHCQVHCKRALSRAAFQSVPCNIGLCLLLSTSVRQQPAACDCCCVAHQCLAGTQLPPTLHHQVCYPQAVLCS